MNVWLSTLLRRHTCARHQSICALVFSQPLVLLTVLNFADRQAERAGGNWLALMLTYAYRVMRVRYVRFRRGEASGIDKHFTERPIWSRLLKQGLQNS